MPAASKTSTSARANRRASSSPSVVDAQRATAALPVRDDDHLASLRGENPGGGRVDIGEEGPLHAAGEHADGRPTVAVRRDPRRHSGRPPQRGCQRFEGGERRRQAPQQPGTADQSPQAAGLVRPQRSAQQTQPLRVREHPEDGGSEQPLPAGPGVPAFHLLPGVLDQPVVVDPGRARGHAGHAAQAPVEVPHHRRAQRLPVEPLLHQVDAPARRIHLLAPQHVRGAGGQAEAAVHAVVDQVPAGRVVVVEGGFARRPGDRSQHVRRGAVRPAALRPGDAALGREVARHVRSLPRSGRARSARPGRTAP